MATDNEAWLPLDLPSDIRLRRLANGGAVGRYLNADLGSVFQPVWSSEARGYVAHEAFVRAHGGGEMSLSPWNLFSLVADDGALVSLDRLCRTVHVLNFQVGGDVDGSLFLNVHGRLLAAVSEDHGRTFRRLLEALQLKPRRIVIETPEAANQDRTLLAFVLSNYRLNGFGVAANTAGLVDLENLLHVVRPDYVKIDTRHLRRHEQLDAAVALAREHGVKPLFTRIENSDVRDYLAAQPGVLLQGLALAAPAERPLRTDEVSDSWNGCPAVSTAAN